MNRFGARVVVLFAVAASLPVALAALVWFGVSRWGPAGASAEAEMARVQLRELDAQRAAAVQRLCRDDLAVDTLLDERGREAPASLDYDRLFRGSMDAAGLQALWVLDSLSGEVLATGHRNRMLGNEGAELTRQARAAGERPFVLLLRAQEHQRFLVNACSIARGGARLTLVAGHRFSDLRNLDPRQLVLTGQAGKGDELVAELMDADGVTQTVLVWRPKIDRRGPPLLLWVACVVVLALGLALLFGGYLNRWLQRSIDELTEAATRVGRGDLDTTLRDGQGGAFPATATAFNRMTRDLRDAREQLRQTERIAAWQEIAKSLAHEIKNPLSPIRLSVETLRKARERSSEGFDAMFDESTKTILQEVDRLRAIVDEFSRFARLPAPKLRNIDLREIIVQAASLHAKGGATFRTALPEGPLTSFVDADQITQVLHNLLRNAQDAAIEAHPDGGGAVGLSVEQSSGTLYIRVEDNGSGISTDQTNAIFEPYYTRKEGGTGLGLAITQRIVTEHGGRIDLESKPGRTVFSVVLPRR
ncbi:MAG: GHKL domain-containing protein [Myxococcales bacterium]|nr:GHKL domain-containing protein [Myxococcales bacterium]